MSTEQVTPTTTAPDRRAALLGIAAGLLSGLPAPKSVGFTADHLCLDFDAAADIDAWADTLHLTEEFTRDAWPYPLLGDYEHWTTRAWHYDLTWHGWKVAADASEPITAAHIAGWVESGRAASAAEYAARETREHNIDVAHEMALAIQNTRGIVASLKQTVRA